MGSKMGTLKVAASKLGLTLDEYLSRIESGMKWCTRCKSWKHVSEFRADRSRGDGRASTCSSCSYVRKTYGPGKRERVSKAADGLSWCRECHDWLSSSEVHAGLCKRHRREYERWRHQTDASYRAERRQHAHGRKRGVAPIPAIGQEVILEDFEGRCAYCNAPATTWDHIVPISKGGETAPWNVVPACHSCNSSKKDRDVMEWLEVRGIDRLPLSVLDRISLEYC
jgi:5-methylcytosine-specific restriction endonuclease McrA